MAEVLKEDLRGAAEAGPLVARQQVQQVVQAAEAEDVVGLAAPLRSWLRLSRRLLQAKPIAAAAVAALRKIEFEQFDLELRLGLRSPSKWREQKQRQYIFCFSQEIEKKIVSIF